MTNTEMLALYVAALPKILNGEEVTMPGNGGRIRRPSLEFVAAEIKRLTPLAAREAAGRSGPSISRGAGT